MKSYSSRKKPNMEAKAAPAREQATPSVPNSVYADVLVGRSHASSAMLGHRQDLAPSLAAKMSKAFGMDLSNVQLYRSQAMAETETQGMASGNKIVLSKDIDLNTMAGQAVLGHELSHVHAQSQGIGMGQSGLYQNAALEHRADSEGWMAARGQSILGDSIGMETGPGMSGIAGLTPVGAGMSASAGAPMQAKKKKKKDTSHADEDYMKEHGSKTPFDDDWNTDNFEAPKPNSEKTWQEVLAGVDFREGKDDQSYPEWMESTKAKLGPDLGENQKKLCLILGNYTREEAKPYMGEDYVQGLNSKMVPKKGRAKTGDAETLRLLKELGGKAGMNASNKEVNEFMSKVNSRTPEDELASRKIIKQIYYKELQRKEKKWGRLVEQMDLQDLLERGGKNGFIDVVLCGLQMEDANEITKKDLQKVSLGNEEDDRRYDALASYYGSFRKLMGAIGGMQSNNLVIPESGRNEANAIFEADRKSALATIAENSKYIVNGPSFTKEQKQQYDAYIKNKKRADLGF